MDITPTSEADKIKIKKEIIASGEKDGSDDDDAGKYKPQTAKKPEYVDLTTENQSNLQAGRVPVSFRGYTLALHIRLPGGASP